MPRRDLLRVRLDRRELRALDELAARLGLDRSALLRALIREAGRAPRPPTLDELLASAAAPIRMD